MTGCLSDYRLVSWARVVPLLICAAAQTVSFAALPTGWACGDIGAVAATGSSSEAGGLFTVRGSGADIEGSADEFQFAYMQFAGDFEISARVVSQQNTDAWAKAGVMIRENLAAGARHAMTVMTPGNGVAFQRRKSTDGGTSSNSQAGVSVPQWVRVKRVGDMLTGYYSSNGRTWTSVASDTVGMGTAVFAGLAVTSHNDGVLCTATFDNVVSIVDSTGPDVTITNVNTDMAMYEPGDAAVIYVDLANTGSTGFEGTVEVRISHLGAAVAELPCKVVSMPLPGQLAVKSFSWTCEARDFQGYLVEVTLRDSSGEVTDRGSSAIDVSSDWRRFPRYGYVSEYFSGLDAEHRMWQLKNYHINGLQFYDWGWKHHVPAPPASWESWPDVAGRTIDREAVTGLISAAHVYNMVAMSYDDWGSAYDDCYTDGSGVMLSMGRFQSAPPSQGNQFTWEMPEGWATPQLRLMNNRDAGWQAYIFARQNEAMSQFGFDGWHMDSLITSWQAYDYSGEQFNVYQYNPQFINNARAATGKRVIYNHIDGTGLDWVAPDAEVDHIYAELWDNYSRYDDLRRFAEEVRQYCSKATVLAAYMNRSLSSGFFNEHSVRLADAAMFACGASHIELGDGGEMLHTEYFPANGVKMTDSLSGVMRAYYDFLVGYENLLRDETVGGDSEVVIDGVASSYDAAPGTVWVIPRKKPGYSIVHLVNLVNNSSEQWCDATGTYAAPPTLSDLQIKMYYRGAIGSGRLRCATPDSNCCIAKEVSFTAGSDAGGEYVSFVVDELEYWDMVWLELNGARSAGGQLEAEDYDTYSAVGIETCLDSRGGLNVGAVKDVDGDSYVGFGNIDFSAGASSVSARVASDLSGGTVEFRLDSPSGPVIATVAVGDTGGWQVWRTRSASVSQVSGVHDLYAVFRDVASNLNWFRFTLAADEPPAAPTGLTASMGDGAVELDWDDNGEADLNGYNVYRSVSDNSHYMLACSGITVSHYSDIEALDGVRYFYVVTAVDDASHESQASNEAAALHYAGDLTFDGRVNMQDVGRLCGGWLVEYGFDSLADVAADWLLDSSLP